MRKKWNFRFVLPAVFFLLLSSPVQGEDEKQKTLSPYFFIEGDVPAVDRFPLKDTQVHVNVNGTIADVTVTQIYENAGSRPINARYVFPASTRASVHGLKMTIGDKAVVAKIKEREAARQEFEKAKKEGKSASLLEQQRPNVFTMNVANIMPKDTVEVELRYTELLTPTEGVYEFVYPTVVGPRYSNTPEAKAAETDKWVKSPYMPEGSLPPTTFDIDVNISTGLPIQELLCPSHKTEVKRPDRSSASVSLAPSGDFAGNRDFILRYRLSGNEIQTGLMLYQGENENHFLLMVQPPERVNPADTPPREYVFILDVSGSMSGFPLNVAKVLINDLIGRLRPADIFNVVLFAGSSSCMAPASIPATRENIAQAIQHIEAQQSGGGTELSPALAKAFSLPRNEDFSRSVIVITDGYIAAESEAFDLIHENLNRSNVFAFGIGTSVNRHLIEGLAKAGLGEPFVATKPEEAPAAAARFIEYVRSPVLTNIQVRYDGFGAYDVEPPRVPDLFAQRPLVVIGEWRGAAAGEIVVSGKSGAGEYRRVIRVSEASPETEHAALRYLWARSRIARLSDFAGARARDDRKPEIVSLGLAYNLLTQHTSFIAVIESVRNVGHAGKDVDQPLPLPLHVSNLAVGGMENASEPETALMLILFALTSALLFPRRRRSSAVRQIGLQGRV